MDVIGQSKRKMNAEEMDTKDTEIGCAALLAFIPNGLHCPQDGC
jgi:hypothetical protein